MRAEITDTKNANGWICFDAECRLCSGCARYFGPLLRRNRFGLVPLQTPWVRERLGRGERELLSEMRLLTPEGRTDGGADALVAIARRIWWARPLYWAAQLALVRKALRSGYRWVARHRTCLGGACASRRRLAGLRGRRRHGGGGHPRRRKRVFFEMP